MRSTCRTAAWYSIVHVPDEQLPQPIEEFHRVLIPGGYLLVAFQAGPEVLHCADLDGYAVKLSFHQRQPDQVADVLGRCGLDVRARVLREPDHGGLFPEQEPQAYVLARKPLTSVPTRHRSEA